MQETLPCGYFDPDDGVTDVIKTVEMVEMTGYEEDLLGNKSKQASGMAINEVLSRCLVSIGDIAPPKAGRGKFFMPHLDKMLVADRTFLMIRLRQLSLGDMFHFEAVCPNCKYRHRRAGIDLSELERKEMEEPTKREWDVELPSKKMATFRALIGKDERKLLTIKKQRKEDLFSSLLMLRLTELDGEKVTSIAQIKGLTTKDRDFLRGRFDDSEGGLDTQIEMTCEDCGYEWQMALPIGESSFFFPSGINA